MTREEIRSKLLSLFSANFNDGGNIEERVGSKDMYSVSSIVEFIDEYVVPYTAQKVLEARLETRIEVNDWYWHHQKYIAEQGVNDDALLEIDVAKTELSKLKEGE